MLQLHNVEQPKAPWGIHKNADSCMVSKKNNKVTSTLFHSEMISNLESTLSKTEYQFHGGQILNLHNLF